MTTHQYRNLTDPMRQRDTDGIPSANGPPQKLMGAALILLVIGLLLLLAKACIVVGIWAIVIATILTFLLAMQGMQ